MEYGSPIFAKGRYRIGAMLMDAGRTSEVIIGYAVLSATGAKIRHELTLDDAKAVIETLLEQDENPSAVQAQARIFVLSPRTRPKPIRR